MQITKAASLLLIGSLACSGDAREKAADGAFETLSVDLTIAGPDGSTLDGFGSVSGLVPLDDGGVLVADALNHVVHRFGPDGARRASIGRQGGGPGEFNRPCCLGIDANHRLWVRDTDSGFDVFQIDADTIYFVRRVRMAHTDANRYAPVTFDDAGNVIDVGSRTETATGERATYRFLVDSTSKVVREVKLHSPPADSTAIREVQRTIPSGLITHFLYQPYGPSELVAHGPRGDFAHALSSHYEIDWRDSDGSLIRHLTGAVAKGPALSPAERAAADTTLSQAAAGVGLSTNDLGFDVPATKPPLRSLFFDRNGRLWVELNVADGAPRRADVYSANGTLERTVQWPSNVSLIDGAIRNDTAWGVARDELGVQTVVRLTF